MGVDFDQVLQRVDGNSFWPSYLTRAFEPNSSVGLHVAIFSEPFLTFILDGHKTIESRFSRNRCAPFGKVAEGDVIFIKEVAGPICGISLAKQTWFFDLAHKSIDTIRHKYEDRICADELFWNAHRNSSYASLVALDEIIPIDPVPYEKRDRRGWVALRSRQLALAL